MKGEEFPWADERCDKTSFSMFDSNRPLQDNKVVFQKLSAILWLWMFVYYNNSFVV